MILYLKNNHIYLPDNNVIAYNDVVRFNIDIKDIDVNNYSFIVDINGEQSQFKNEFMLTRSQLKHKYLNLKIIAIHNETGEEIIYTSDSYPITKAIVLGRPCSEWYPEVIQDLKERIKTLELYQSSHNVRISNNSSEIEDIKSDVTRVELAIKELNEIGEVV